MWAGTGVLLFVLFANGIAASVVSAATLAELTGQTMGTSYSIKLYAEPDQVDELRLAVDRELRRVSSQMSTYLKTSEITRFNESKSTQWFDTSAEFRDVVAASLRISEVTEGAFDVTIGPYIDLWNFGARKRTGEAPSDAMLGEASTRVGFAKLHVRQDPPAIRKDQPDLQIDLSAIAKGHGVDRVIDLLLRTGCRDAFVEIGGEVRVVGDKGGQPWRVGIQMPDGDANELLLAHEMSGSHRAMATSGDYRNYFEADGRRYSHTLDPRTRRPVEHSLASVTVMSSTCMLADAWATALTVLGPDDGYRMASDLGLETLLVSRTINGFERRGTGMLTQYAQAAIGPVLAESMLNRLAPMFLVTALIFAAVLIAMAIGVLVGRHAISGSCGGIAGTENEDGSVSCSLCSNPADACKDLRQKLKEENVT